MQYDDLLCVGEDYQFDSGLICKKIMDREKVFLTWPTPATSTFSPAGDMSKIRSPISMDRQSFDGDGLFRRCVIMASPGGYTNNWSWVRLPSTAAQTSLLLLEAHTTQVGLITCNHNLLWSATVSVNRQAWQT